MEARAHYGKLKETLSKLETDSARREWLVENVKGLGWKEASHLLRNIGFFGFAIVDRHIIDIMRAHRMIKKAPKTLNKKVYLECEAKLGMLCSKLGTRNGKPIVNQGELDFYLWYMETGKILK